MADGSFGKPERAIIHSYNMNAKKWDKTVTQLQIETESFSEGAFRMAHRARMKYKNKMETFVCKFAKDKNTERMLYYNDIEAQVYAYQWAKKFNEYKTPRKITFVPAFVLELVDRPGRPVCGCERLIQGEFRKHNNNVGAVCTYPGDHSKESKMDVKIAQAFSHFTYSNSNGQILICDIQGVEGMYTDPQIHTSNGKGFGGGNLGSTGIRAFLLRHQCNDICQSVGLATIKPSELGENSIKDQIQNANCHGTGVLSSLPDPSGPSEYGLHRVAKDDVAGSHPKSPSHSEWQGMGQQQQHHHQQQQHHHHQQQQRSSSSSNSSSSINSGMPPLQQSSSSPTQQQRHSKPPSSFQNKGVSLASHKAPSASNAAKQALRPPSADLKMTSMDERLMDSILNM
mmetsp:Transcript_49798/g.97642  ORF Transcript_49798/g.97642 Transcript_49798/m.97642 type:complete len:398 (+) Transcript_49798:145-1338(+)